METEMLPGKKQPTKPRSKTPAIEDLSELVAAVQSLQHVSENRQAQIERLDKDLQELRRAMYGHNGDLGVCSRLANVEEVVTVIKKLAFIIVALIVTLMFSEFIYLLVTHGHVP